MDSIDMAIKVLNEALEADEDAISSLLALEVECNSLLGDHPTIQVGKHSNGISDRIRPLGLINGLFGAAEDTSGFIGAEADPETGKIYCFVRMR